MHSSTTDRPMPEPQGLFTGPTNENVKTRFSSSPPDRELLQIKGPSVKGRIGWRGVRAGAMVVALGILDGRRLDARAMWDAGGRPGLATRSNPDGRMVNGITLAISLLVTVGGLDPWEAIWSATRGGARALGDDERGRLRMGDAADFVILDMDDPMDLVRRPDSNPAWRVVAAGRAEHHLQRRRAALRGGRDHRAGRLVAALRGHVDGHGVGVVQPALILDPHFDRVEPEGQEIDDTTKEIVFRLRFLYDPGVGAEEPSAEELARVAAPLGWPVVVSSM